MVFAGSPQRGARERSSYCEVVMDFYCKSLRIEKLSIWNGLMCVPLLERTSQFPIDETGDESNYFDITRAALGQVLV
jgi:hypothetical protein